MPAYDHRPLSVWHQESGKRLEEVCVLVPVSYSYLRDVMRGVKQPSIEMLTRIAAVYGRDMRDLFTNDAASAGAR
jgi:transcriptional regulator with XRE-family HTH domain